MPRKIKLHARINGIDVHLQQRGRLWSMRFTDARAGGEQRIPTKCTDPQKALLFAERYMMQYTPGQGSERITVGALVEALLRFKQVQGAKDFIHARSSWTVRLKDKFAAWDCRDLTDEVITDYKAWVLGEPIDDLTTALRRSWSPIAVPLGKSTINRDLAVLSKAYRDNKIARQHAPRWGKYPEKELPVRQGRVAIPEFDAIMALDLPLWWRTYLQLIWDAGNRSGEYKKLRVSQFETFMMEVDGKLEECGGFQLARGHNRDDAATEKNGNGRWVPLSKRGLELVKQLVTGKAPNELVFSRENGLGMGDHRDLWNNTVKEAGIERKILLHDFRRTAITDMRAAKVDMKASMETVGHTGEHVHRRYQITDKAGLIDAMRQKEAYVEAKRGTAPAADPQADAMAVIERQLEEANKRNELLMATLETLQRAVTAISQPQVGIFATPVEKEAVQ